MVFYFMRKDNFPNVVHITTEARRDRIYCRAHLIFEPRRLFFHRETSKIHIRISEKPYKNF